MFVDIHIRAVANSFICLLVWFRLSFGSVWLSWWYNNATPSPAPLHSL